LAYIGSLIEGPTLTIHFILYAVMLVCEQEGLTVHVWGVSRQRPVPVIIILISALAQLLCSVIVVNVRWFNDYYCWVSKVLSMGV